MTAHASNVSDAVFAETMGALEALNERHGHVPERFRRPPLDAATPPSYTSATSSSALARGLTVKSRVQAESPDSVSGQGPPGTSRQKMTDTPAPSGDARALYADHPEAAR